MKHIAIVGTVEGEPVMDRIQDKWDACKFTAKVKDPGEKYPDFYKVEVFGNKAREVFDSIADGSWIAASGKPRAFGYKGKKDGEAKGGIEIKSATVEVLFPGVSAPSEDREEPRIQPGDHQRIPKATPTTGKGTDDLPF